MHQVDLCSEAFSASSFWISPRILFIVNSSLIDAHIRR